MPTRPTTLSHLSLSASFQIHPLPSFSLFRKIIMSKRSHTQLHTPADPDGQPPQKARSSEARRPSVTDDMGEFEDAWEDEIEEEELPQDTTNDDPNGLSTPIPGA